MSIEIKNLSYVYNQGSALAHKAVDGISLVIPDGQFVGLIGQTGSGKSTLIQHLNALIKPTSGEILIDGENINDPNTNMRKIRQKVGLIFQYPEHQLFESTVYKDVSFGPENMGLEKEEIDRRVREALEITGLDERDFEKSPLDLSGGQKRRVAIAGVLAMRPRILILDEPTAGLDPRGRDEVLREISHMHKELQMTIILVSHSMEDVAKLAERLLVMHQSKVVLDGTPVEVFSQMDYLEQIGLAAPQISYLVRQLRERGFDLPQTIFTVQDAHQHLMNILKGDRPC